MWLLILLVTCFYAVFAWRRLDLAMAFLIVFLPTYQIRFIVFGLPTTLLEVMILVLFTVWFVQSLKNKQLPLFNKGLKQVRHYPFWKEIIAVLIIAFVSMLVAGAGNNSLGILKAYFIEPVMFFIVFVNVFSAHNPTGLSGQVLDQGKNRNLIFGALATSALLISIATIYQKITGQFIPMEFVNSGRMTGVFDYPNAVGLYLGPIIILLGGWLLARLKISNFQFSIFNQFSISNFQNLAVGFVMLISILSIYLARSEGALIGILAAGIIFGLLYSKRSRWVVVGLVITGAIILSFNTGLRHDVVKKVTLMDKDGQIRRQLWHETWQMLSDNPRNFIFGAGLANYQQKIIPYHESGIYIRNDDPQFDKMVRISLEYQQQVWQPLEIYLYPHNILLNFWSELGFLGMLLFVWVIIKFLILDFRIMITDKKNRSMLIGLLGAMIVIVVHGLVDVPYFKNDLAVMFWVLVGMIDVLRLEVRGDKYKKDVIIVLAGGINKDGTLPNNIPKFRVNKGVELYKKK